MKSTEEILNEIKSDSNYIPVDTRMQADLSLFLKSELSSINLKQMFTSLDIDVTNGYKYIKGERQLSRDQLTKILIFLSYDLNQIQQTFKQFGYPYLYAKNIRDAALIYCLHNNYNYQQVKCYLRTNNLLGL